MIIDIFIILFIFFNYSNINIDIYPLLNYYSLNTKVHAHCYWVGRKKNQLSKEKMEKKLYVGNLPYSLSDEALKDLFTEAGEVAAASIIIDKFSKRSKGFGFVEMSTEEDAAKAKDIFNGKEVEGRKLIVDEARPMKDFKGE